MKRFVCKQCGKYWDSSEESVFRNHNQKYLMDKILQVNPDAYDAVKDIVDKKYHMKDWRGRDCGPVELEEFDEYWIQMEHFIGRTI